MLSIQNPLILLFPGWIVGITLFAFTRFLRNRMENQLKPATIKITHPKN